MTPLNPDLDKLLRTAIEQKRLVRLRYQAKDRTIEPHDYGIKNGSVKLLAYQIKGASSTRLPSWKWLEVDQISDAQALDQHFRGGRGASVDKHHQWDELFMRVKPADE